MEGVYYELMRPLCFGSQIAFTNDYDCENSILNASALPVSSLLSNGLRYSVVFF